jgi:hypothetical protein
VKEPKIRMEFAGSTQNLKISCQNLNSTDPNESFPKKTMFSTLKVCKILSDHRIIRFKMSSDLRPPYQYRNPRSTNWEFFEKEIESGLWAFDADLNGVQAFENYVVTIQKSLVAAYEESCPLKTADQGCRWCPALGL